MRYRCVRALDTAPHPRSAACASTPSAQPAPLFHRNLAAHPTPLPQRRHPLICKGVGCHPHRCAGLGHGFAGPCSQAARHRWQWRGDRVRTRRRSFAPVQKVAHASNPRLSPGPGIGPGPDPGPGPQPVRRQAPADRPLNHYPMHAGVGIEVGASAASSMVHSTRLLDGPGCRRGRLHTVVSGFG